MWVLRESSFRGQNKSHPTMRVLEKGDFKKCTSEHRRRELLALFVAKTKVIILWGLWKHVTLKSAPQNTYGENSFRGQNKGHHTTGVLKTNDFEKCTSEHRRRELVS